MRMIHYVMEVYREIPYSLYKNKYGIVRGTSGRSSKIGDALAATFGTRHRFPVAGRCRSSHTRHCVAHLHN